MPTQFSSVKYYCIYSALSRSNKNACMSTYLVFELLLYIVNNIDYALSLDDCLSSAKDEVKCSSNF